MSNILNKIKNSAIQATKGKEEIGVVVWYWGVISYLVSYFIINKTILWINWSFYSVVMSGIMFCYYAWHVYAIMRCRPKKPKLTKEEKKQLKLKRRQELGKKLLRKLLSQEPITNWDSSTVIVAIDLLFVINYFENLLY